MRCRTHALLWSLSSLLICVSVRAHDPPEISGLLWGDDGNSLVLRTNRGLIFGKPGAQDWRLMCGDAWGTPFGEQPDLVYLPDRQLMAATTVGLQVSNDEGCTWRGIEPFAATTASALVQHPADPMLLYLGIWDADRSGLYESHDAGASWSKRLNVGRSDHIAQILLAPSDPRRIYLNGLVHDEQVDKYSFQVTRSIDAGVTWKRLYVPLLANEDESILMAVSPREPETLLVIAKAAQHGVDPDRLLISRDGGASWQTLMQAPSLLGAGFSIDGTTAFVAGNEGFYRSNMQLTEAVAVGDAQFVSQVSTHGDALYLCGNHSGFDPINAGVGVSRDDAESFSRLMAFTEVKRTVSCAADSKTSRLCKNLWTDWQIEVLVGVGGAPIESVPDWKSFDSAEPEPMSGRPTLSSTMTQPKVQPEVDEAGCNATRLARRDHASSLFWLCTLLLLRLRRRNATSDSSDKQTA
ncbi:MAG TPA: hypothetical protein VJV78_31555 [Polyangiales bacterium]|nr:hypothetical protein [Polyangiales bacterium]